MTETARFINTDENLEVTSADGCPNCGHLERRTEYERAALSAVHIMIFDGCAKCGVDRRDAGNTDSECGTCGLLQGAHNSGCPESVAQFPASAVDERSPHQRMKDLYGYGFSR
ncbi:DNA-directed RNA polymerase subunit RPC12/RpoP [Microbacterium sp. BE35]|uniref:hypothetical protein n=1 Tax=Microbacterium sp. BE35 TaxID=2817773 RepID=UPI00285D86E1|nr:hypothetical protein [Microbacterium sp. BE35]MDR7189752.1 DNA-directed RNA polymerase subunit RPC12/RpoP [Microbacterium sp. BE35]